MLVKVEHKDQWMFESGGEGFRGFIEGNADKIFESTDRSSWWSARVGFDNSNLSINLVSEVSFIRYILVFSI